MHAGPPEPVPVPGEAEAHPARRIAATTNPARFLIGQRSFPGRTMPVRPSPAENFMVVHFSTGSQSGE